MILFKYSDYSGVDVSVLGFEPLSRLKSYNDIVWITYSYDKIIDNGCYKVVLFYVDKKSFEKYM